MAKKTWEEKLASTAEREVKRAPKDFADIKQGQMMLLTTAKDVAAEVATLRAGEGLDTKGLRARLSARYGADIACPVMTGIHFRTVAEVAAAKLEAGIAPEEVVPVWRVMPPKAPIWKKLTNGAVHFQRLRQAEGLPISG